MKSKKTYLLVLVLALALSVFGAAGVAYGANKSSERQLYSTEQSKQASTAVQQKGSIAVHRVFNPQSGEHLFTTNVGEKRSLCMKAGWKYEGVAWYAPRSGGIPVYRFYNKKNHMHSYIANTNTVNYLKANANWSYEGVCWYSDRNKRVPVTRFFNPSQPSISANHYTANAGEVNALDANASWKNYGVPWYGVAKGNSNIKDGWVKEGKYYKRYNEGKLVTGEWWITTVQIPTGGTSRLPHKYLVKNGVLNMAAQGTPRLYMKPYQWLAYQKVCKRGSKTNWYVVTDIGCHKLMVFKREKPGGFWTLYDEWKISSGILDGGRSRTPLKDSKVGGRTYQLNGGNWTAYWATYWGGTWWHSIIYRPYSRIVSDPRLGRNVSNGCIRMTDAQAKWLYDNIPRGTSVTTWRK